MKLNEKRKTNENVLNRIIFIDYKSIQSRCFSIFNYRSLILYFVEVRVELHKEESYIRNGRKWQLVDPRLMLEGDKRLTTLFAYLCIHV